MKLKRVKIILNSEKEKAYTVTLLFAAEIYLKCDESQNRKSIDDKLIILM